MKNHDLTTIHQRAPVTQIRRENQAKFKSSTGSGRARMKREKEPILDAFYCSREESTQETRNLRTSLGAVLVLIIVIACGKVISSCAVDIRV
jgi:hypothetical protein